MGLGTAAGPGVAAAHGGSLGAAAREQLAVPTWLFLATGGGAVGASFLLSSFVTDRALVAAIHSWHRGVALPRGLLARAGRLVGLVGLAAFVVTGLAGPREPLANLAVLGVWVGWWAGFAAATYLVGNAWPAINPWRTVARALPSLDRGLPGVGAWPSVAGLLALIWIEVVSPLADRPRLLVAVVLGYSAVTLAGAVVVGPVRWFASVDPVSRVFRYYGRVAPVTRDRDADGTSRLRLRLPGTGLTDTESIGSDGEVAFVVAILWATTYDGLVTTPAWRGAVRTLVGAGVPAGLVYPAALVAGFLAVLGSYRLAVRYSRRTADTYRSSGDLARRFAPPLLAIAAGYHLAHYLGYFLSLAPALAAATASPLSATATVPVLALPEWFGGVELAAVLAGHLLAVWVAHAIAFEAFPGRLQAIRSQYPVVLAMVVYTTASLWIVSQPEVPPPYV
ncbi:hypothetical protein BRC83_10225 [Halobacteriales archaeon QS_1_68_17]|nr:MAG: hypothetical protein BRC83_10225 [Halobacteriales archaeon QS_1_68_17]